MNKLNCVSDLITSVKPWSATSSYIYLITPTVPYLNPCHTWMILRRGLESRHNFKVGTRSGRGLGVGETVKLETRNRWDEEQIRRGTDEIRNRQCAEQMRHGTDKDEMGNRWGGGWWNNGHSWDALPPLIAGYAWPWLYKMIALPTYLSG